MKTYEEFIDEVVTEEYKRINPVAMNIHKNAAKKYAKQWVALAATEAGDDSRTVTQNANVIWKMKEEIDAQ